MEVLLDVKLDPKSHRIVGVQFELEHDPEQLELLEFDHGTALGSDPVVIQKISDRPGVSLYAVARRGSATPADSPGTVATATLQVRENLAPGTPVQVSLQRVKIADENVQPVSNVRVDPPLQLVVAP